jgi:hypothetical protein
MTNRYVKDPDAILDYKWDFAPTTNASDTTKADYLESGETIASTTVTAEAGLTVGTATPVATADSDTSVVAWLEGGTAGTTYAVTCQIVTSAGRTDERTIYVEVTER